MFDGDQFAGELANSPKQAEHNAAAHAIADIEENFAELSARFVKPGLACACLDQTSHV